MGSLRRLILTLSILAFSVACGVKGAPLPPESRPDPEASPSASPTAKAGP